MTDTPVKNSKAQTQFKDSRQTDSVYKRQPKRTNEFTYSSDPAKLTRDEMRENFVKHLVALAEGDTSRGFFATLENFKKDPSLLRRITDKHRKERLYAGSLGSNNAQVRERLVFTDDIIEKSNLLFGQDSDFVSNFEGPAGQYENRLQGHYIFSILDKNFVFENNGGGQGENGDIFDSISGSSFGEEDLQILNEANMPKRPEITKEDPQNIVEDKLIERINEILQEVNGQEQYNLQIETKQESDKEKPKEENKKLLHSELLQTDSAEDNTGQEIPMTVETLTTLVKEFEAQTQGLEKMIVEDAEPKIIEKEEQNIFESFEKIPQESMEIDPSHDTKCNKIVDENQQNAEAELEPEELMEEEIEEDGLTDPKARLRIYQMSTVLDLVIREKYKNSKSKNAIDFKINDWELIKVPRNRSKEAAESEANGDSQNGRYKIVPRKYTKADKVKFKVNYDDSFLNKVTLPKKNKVTEDKVKIKLPMIKQRDTNKKQKSASDKYGMEGDGDLLSTWSQKNKKKVKKDALWITHGITAKTKSLKENDRKQSVKDDFESASNDDRKGSLLSGTQDDRPFRKESENTDIYNLEDGRRRSQREKREPRKNYDKALLGKDYDFTFVDFKQHKVQKLNIIVSFKALLMMNLHAHLSTFEVIGLLGGKVISEDEIVIEEALPCTNISESSNAHSVEMDPTSQVETQEKLEKMGYKNLGWYHSHPVFKTTPSQIDQETHFTHQTCYKEHPYIGVIIGPYSTDKRSSKTKADIFFFHVIGSQTYKLAFRIKAMPYFEQRDVEEIEDMIKQYRSFKKGIKPYEKWKKTVTYKDKIMSCFATLFEENMGYSMMPEEGQENSEIPGGPESALSQGKPESDDNPSPKDEIGKEMEQYNEIEYDPSLKQSAKTTLKEKDKVDLCSKQVIQSFLYYIENLLLGKE